MMMIDDKTLSSATVLELT